MFKSNRKVSLFAKALNFVWPRLGFRRAWDYRMARLARLRVCPHRLSLGFAAGAFASFTPFIGLHFIIAAALAFVIRGNLVASAVGTVVGNPLTFPMIWLSTYKLGNALIFGSHSIVDGASGQTGPSLATNSLEELWHALEPVLWPMVVGSLPLGLAAAATCYAAVYWSLRPLQRRGSAVIPARPQSP